MKIKAPTAKEGQQKHSDQNSDSQGQPEGSQEKMELNKGDHPQKKVEKSPDDLK